MMNHPIPLVGLLASWCFGACGCYNAGQVRAFLRKPRAPVSGLEYRVYPPDVIAITSLHVPEIHGVSQQIRPDGKINLPLLGEIYAAGKTPAEIESALTEAAKDYYEQVDATVTVSGYNSQWFYVFGQVAQRGPVAWTGHDTLLDVLARAQPTPLAWPERIIVLRPADPQEGGYATSQPSVWYWATGVHWPPKDKPPKKIIVNLMAMVESGDMANNILLMPNDVVYVQADPFAKLALGIEKLMFPVRAVSDGLGDFRELVTQVRWIMDRMPTEGGEGRGTLITR